MCRINTKTVLKTLSCSHSIWKSCSGCFGYGDFFGSMCRICNGLGLVVEGERKCDCGKRAVLIMKKELMLRELEYIEIELSN